MTSDYTVALLLLLLLLAPLLQATARLRARCPGGRQMSNEFEAAECRFVCREPSVFQEVFLSEPLARHSLKDCELSASAIR